MNKQKPPIFIGGAGRSGTTLIRVILDSHTHIACGPELKVTPIIAKMWQDFRTAFAPTLQNYSLTPKDINILFADFIQSLLQKFCDENDKQRIAEKSPNNIFFFQHFHHIFPDSPLIHVIRDGRDVVTSLLKMNWVDSVTGKPVDYTQDAGRAAEYWLNAIRIGQEFTKQIPTAQNRYYEIKYEDIVRDPEPTLKNLFTFLDEPWEEDVLNFHQKDRKLANESSAEQVQNKIHSNSLERWKTELDDFQREKIKEIAGQTLIDLGYADNFDW